MKSSSWFHTGHYTDQTARTGCTVVMFDRQVPAAVDVRGGASGTRETTLLAPTGRGVVDAIVLSGGSAFGLATVDGVVRFLSEQGRGFRTPAGPVPLVPGAIIYDLAVGEPLSPTADDGYAAAEACVPGPGDDTGAVGAGTGATVAKIGGSVSPGGVGIGSISTPAGEVTAIVVINSIGDVVDPATGGYLRKTEDPDGLGRSGRELLIAGRGRAGRNENTSIGVIVVDTALDRDGLWRCCVAAHDALARCVVPSHTVFDGDTFFAAARDFGVIADETARTIPVLSAATEAAVETAITTLFRDQ